MKSAGIVVARKVEGAIKIASHIIKLLNENGLDILLYPPIFDNVPTVDRIEALNVDFVISIGGDGTVLRTLLFLPNKNIPVLGIGMGERNFLSIADPSNYPAILEKVLQGNYKICEEMRLEVEIEGEKQNYPPVLNEVLFGSRITGKTCEIHVGITDKEERHLWHCKADGIIVSTPIGSTAYAYAAGGPVIDTELEGLLIVPLVPVYRRPVMVLNPNRKIVLWAGTTRSPPLLVLDGQIRVEVDYLQRVYIKKSQTPARFIVVDDDISLSRLIKISRQ